MVATVVTTVAGPSVAKPVVVAVVVVVVVSGISITYRSLSSAINLQISVRFSGHNVQYAFLFDIQLSANNN